MSDARPPGSGAPSPEERAREVAEMIEVGRAPRLSRRQFIGLLLAGGGGAAVGGFAGYAIGYSNRPDGAITVIQEPTTSTTVAGEPPAQPQMLVFYPRVPVASLGDLTVGEPVLFEYPLAGQKAALVKLGKPALYGLGPDEDIVAFSTRCTHMGWPLDAAWDPETCLFGPCPGHFSTFDATVGGQVALGQATTNLPQIVLLIEGDTIYAEGVLGLIYGYRDNLLDGTPVEVRT